jgi:hypothetical protein
MLLSSTWRVGVGKGFTLPHLHGYIVVKVINLPAHLPWCHLRTLVSSERVAQIQLARKMVIEVRAEGLPFEYIVFDSWYNAKWFAK